LNKRKPYEFKTEKEEDSSIEKIDFDELININET